MNETQVKADSELIKAVGNAAKHVSQNWLRYSALMVTGALTGLAGWTLTGNPFYTVAIVLLAEGASLFWTARAGDNGNVTQAWLSYIGGGIAWIAIIITDLASATIIAKLANIEIFTAFQDVPIWAQRVITYVLPVLAVLHGVLGTAHHYFSEDAKLARDVADSEREAERQIKQARANADVNIAKAQAAKYKELSERDAPMIGETQAVTAWQSERGARVTTTTPAPLSGNATTTHDELISEIVKRVTAQMRAENVSILANDAPVTMEAGQAVPFRGNGHKS